jgi:outer membrane protein
MRTLFLLAAIGFTTLVSNAQNPQKIAFADVDEIYNEMPESKQIETDLQSIQTQLKNQIDAKVKDFQTKFAQYQKEFNNMLPAVKENTERELQQAQQNIEKLQQDAETTVRQKQAQLMEPVYDKVNKAIEAVAGENGYSLILSARIGGLDVVLFGDEKLDVSDLVLKKMGVTPKPKTPATPQK